MRAAVGLLLIAGLGHARDWKQHPAVVEVSASADIFAIGDAHADYVRLTNAMRAAGIIDTSMHWAAGKAVLVTTGDMIDKGPRAVDVLRLLKSLRDEAPRFGGRVIALAGNHEAEFMADYSPDKFDGFKDDLKKVGLKADEVAGCGGDIGAFLCSLPFAAKVNDWYFSHAGNTKGRTIEQIERDVEADFDQHGFAAQHLIGDYSILEARLNGTGKGREPWIDTGLPSIGERELLLQYARALGVRHIVEGHVPSPVDFADGVKRDAGQMFQRWGLLFLIDTGMSSEVNESLGAVLHISGGKAMAVCPSGTKTEIWNVNSSPKTGRAAACR
jgi:hypothetical protein